jgi:hypothetical protein
MAARDVIEQTLSGLKSRERDASRVTRAWVRRKW